MSISHHPGDPVADPIHAEWTAGGPHENWAAATKRASNIKLVGVTLQTNEDTASLATHWSKMLDLPIKKEGSVPYLECSNARLKFVKATDGRGDGISQLDVAVRDVSAAKQRAVKAGGTAKGDCVELVGTLFNFLPLSDDVGHGPSRL